jgi:hypothetical protein
METLSLGDIAKLAGYSRARIHRFAVDGRIPGDPLRRPPKGQYRFRDTPELRDWCKAKRKTKPKAMPRRSRPDNRSFSAHVRAAIGDMVKELESGTADPSDIRDAIALLDACHALVAMSAPLEGVRRPCTKGVLATVAHFLLRSQWQRFDTRLFVKGHTLFGRLRKELSTAMRKAERSSRNQPA